MVDNKLKEYLDIHIPYRLQAIDGLRWACKLIATSPHTESVELCFDGKKVATSSTFRFVTNPMVEVGSIYCRVLLEFLGVGLAAKKDRLKAKPDEYYKPDDITLQSFGLSRLGVDQIRKAPTATPDEIEKACVSTILTADKAIAHLTYGLDPPQNIPDLHICSLTVPWLICQYLYRALDLPEPRYKIGSVA